MFRVLTQSRGAVSSCISVIALNKNLFAYCKHLCQGSSVILCALGRVLVLIQICTVLAQMCLAFLVQRYKRSLVSHFKLFVEQGSYAGKVQNKLPEYVA